MIAAVCGYMDGLIGASNSPVSGVGILAALGISLVQWDALRHLHEHPDASLHRLAQLTFQTDQSFGALAARMIDRGLIERVPGPGRAVRHRLTPRGDSLRVEAAEVLHGVLVESFSPLSPAELATFATLLAKLVPGPEAGR